MSYMKHKVSLPKNLEDLEDGDGASAIYIGDTKIIPTNIGGLGQRTRKPGIPYWLDHAVTEWIRVWSDTHDTNDYLVVTVNIPSHWTAYEALVSDGAPGNPASGTYSSNIGTIFNATGMPPWGMGSLNDGWGYESDWQNRFDLTKNPSGDIWAALDGLAPERFAQCRFTIARGDGWWSAGSNAENARKRQTYGRRVLYRLAAFEAGLFMDHPQSLWTTVLTDRQVMQIGMAIHNLIGGSGLSDYYWAIEDAEKGLLDLHLHAGQAHSASINELFTDPTLQPLGEPRTVWDYTYSTSQTEQFNIGKSFTHKSLVDGDSLELSHALNTTHQVIWLTPDLAFSGTGTIKLQFTDYSAGKKGYVEARWLLESMSQTMAVNTSAGTNDYEWEDTFAVSTTLSMGAAPFWNRLIVGWRSRNTGDHTGVSRMSQDVSNMSLNGQWSSFDRAIAIGIVVPKEWATYFSATIEVTRDNLPDPTIPTNRINGLW